MKFFLLFIFFISSASDAQTIFLKDNSNLFNKPGQQKNIFSQDVFIRNIGQYGNEFINHPDMGEIKYGFEGFNMPVLFTAKGLIYLHRKVKKYSKKQEEELEKKGVSEEVIERGEALDKAIAVEWLNTNNNVEIIADSAIDAYFTYGLLKEKTYGYKKITYKELYPNIDLVFHFNNSSKIGFEYTFIVKPNGNVNDIKINYEGDVKQITTIQNGGLLISSGFDTIIEKKPLSFIAKSALKQNNTFVSSSFKKDKNIVSFSVDGYDRSQTLYIDPFVSSTGTLTGANNGIAKDIDYDYEGNIYVVGGGDASTNHKLAKYNASGILQWTFAGSLTTPSWAFGGSYGGWVVEKNTGKIFLGQGLILPAGSKVIRLSTAGVYDNFITSASSNFSENWKMIWSCNSGTPQILIGGGTSTSNNSIGVCTPPNTAVYSVNLTGSPAFYQDIADIIIDPVNNDMYTIYASGIASINNKIYKHNSPYNSSSIAWNTPSGYSTLAELKNRPYLSSNIFGDSDNSANILTANSNYLFYWDGLNLKAFNKANGTTVGTPLVITPNTALLQGGIIADECNNVFIGSTNGTIKAFKFNGTVFDDAAAADIVISTLPGGNIFDLAYDQTRQLLYACGSGLVASFDISGYCATTSYTLTVTPDCGTLSAQAIITPTPPASTAVTYALFIGSTQIESNATGFFTGLTIGGAYTIKAFLNQTCGGLQMIKNFVIDNCSLSVNTTFVNPSCNGAANGSITATASFGTPPYQYSIDGTNYQSSGVFNNLSLGSYIITIKDFTNAVVTSPPIILDNSATLQLSVNSTNVTCGLINGTITATASGGMSPLLYSIDGVNYQASNSFVGLSANNYTVYVKDVNNCIATTPIIIIVITPPTLSASAIATNCNNVSGTIIATAGLGSLPYQYSIDGINFQSSNIFNGLATNNYIVTLKDASGCINSFPVTVGLTNTLTVSAGSNITICEGTKVQLSATSNGTSFIWSPSIGLSNHLVLNPFASPTVTTDYMLIATDGVCTKSNFTKVLVNPAPIANAGNDTSICFGKNIQLNGSGALAYKWKPSTYLNSTTIFNPIGIKPNSGIISYSLSVTDNNGCKSIKEDTVTINVSTHAKLFAGNDTAIIINLPFQLIAKDVNNIGFTNYVWSPVYGLSNVRVYNPIAILDKDMKYTVYAENSDGCASVDSIDIKVYKGPFIYIPNAFTPNKDNLNDNLRALPIGIKEFKYFSIYNRYGQMVFKTANPSIGWDGTFKGLQQSTGTYTWIVEAIDNKGLIYSKKGIVVLLR